MASSTQSSFPIWPRVSATSFTTLPLGHWVAAVVWTRNNCSFNNSIDWLSTNTQRKTDIHTLTGGHKCKGPNCWHRIAQFRDRWLRLATGPGGRSDQLFPLSKVVSTTGYIDLHPHCTWNLLFKAGCWVRCKERQIVNSLPRIDYIIESICVTHKWCNCCYANNTTTGSHLLMRYPSELSPCPCRLFKTKTREDNCILFTAQCRL